MIRSIRRSRLFALPLVSALVSLATPVHAVPGGTLHTLLKGTWTCEWPGDATALPKPSPESSFRAAPDSSYRTSSGASGNYLLLGNRLTMTSGPFRGREFTLVGTTQLHRLDAKGARDGMRCVHGGPAIGNEGFAPDDNDSARR